MDDSFSSHTDSEKTVERSSAEKETSEQSTADVICSKPGVTPSEQAQNMVECQNVDLNTTVPKIEPVDSAQHAFGSSQISSNLRSSCNDYSDSNVPSSEPQLLLLPNDKPDLLSHIPRPDSSGSSVMSGMQQDQGYQNSVLYGGQQYHVNSSYYPSDMSTNTSPSRSEMTHYNNESEIAATVHYSATPSPNTDTSGISQWYPEREAILPSTVTLQAPQMAVQGSGSPSSYHSGTEDSYYHLRATTDVFSGCIAPATSNAEDGQDYTSYSQMPASSSYYGRPMYHFSNQSLPFPAYDYNKY